MILVVLGPTCVGKTNLSIDLAKKYNGEIINADSMQVYRGLDIGTAKITEEEKDNIPHHLFDIKEVTDNYTVYDYQKDARNIINKVLAKNKVPIIVGGTGLYIKAALYNYDFAAENHKDYSSLSINEIIDKIKKYNIATNVDFNNRRRLERLLSKLENNTYNSNKSDKLLYNDVYFIGLTTNRETLYKRINKRVIDMFNNGLVDEVKHYINDYQNSKALQTGIGYKEVVKYLKGNISKEECIELIQKNSRHYAKRQYTFFNNQLPVKWYITDYNNFENTIKAIEKDI